MSLRTKTLLILGAAVIGITVSVYALASRILLGGFAQVEARTADQSVEIVRHGIQNELNHIRSKTTDYSRWNEIYQFAKDRNPDFIKTNLYEETFTNLGIDLLAVFDTKKELVYMQGFDVDYRRFAPAPTDLMEYLRLNPGLLSGSETDPGRDGIVMLKEHAWLMASRPILTSEGQGPRAGTVLMGLALDDDDVQRLVSVVGRSFKLSRLDRPGVEPKLVESIEASPFRGHVRELNDNEIESYGLLRTIDGGPALLITVSAQRTIYSQGVTSVRTLALALAAAGLILGALTLFIMEILVLSRIAWLAGGVRKITAGESGAEALNLKGNDELTRLSGDVERMLAAQIEARRQLRVSEDALRVSEAKYRSLIERIPAVTYIVRLDEKGTIQFISPQIVKLIGQGPAELSAGHSHWLPLVHPDDCEKVRSEWKRCREFGSSFVAEYRLIHKNGKTVWVRDEAVLVKDPEPYLEGVLADISALKQAAEDQARLERIAEARQRLALLGEFAAGVAHELRNPLHGVLNCMELLRTRLSTGCCSPEGVREDDIEEFLALAEEGLRRMDAISSRILQLGRDAIGPKVPTNVGGLVEATMAFLRPRAQQMGLSLNVAIPSELAAPMDGARISEALLNLVSNAMDACTEVEAPAITVSACMSSRAEGLMELSVADNGPGIPEEVLAKIFDPFFTTKAHGKGSGLGLAISRKIVEIHGGHIEVSSRSGAGATFTMFLPLRGTETLSTGENSESPGS